MYFSSFTEDKTLYCIHVMGQSSISLHPLLWLFIKSYTRVVKKVREQLRTVILVVFSCFSVAIQHLTILFSNFCSKLFQSKEIENFCSFFNECIRDIFLFLSFFSIFRLSLELFNLLNFIVYAFINVVLGHRYNIGAKIHSKNFMLSVWICSRNCRTCQWRQLFLLKTVSQYNLEV